MQTSKLSILLTIVNEVVFNYFLGQSPGMWLLLSQMLWKTALCTPDITNQPIHPKRCLSISMVPDRAHISTTSYFERPTFNFQPHKSSWIKLEPKMREYLRESWREEQFYIWLESTRNQCNLSRIRKFGDHIFSSGPGVYSSARSSETTRCLTAVLLSASFQIQLLQSPLGR
jgi:hypothetical protein